ncbi:MAG: TRAP transporter large permease subunit [bacterium]
MMTPEMIGWISIAALFVLLLLRIPIAFILAAIGFCGFWAITGIDPALRLASLVPYSAVAVHSFSVVPLFILMGHFVFHAGFATDVYRSARLWIGRFPGGLAQATVVAGAAFAAASGSGFASCATLAKVTIPEMTRFGVNRKLAFGVVAAAGTIAQMIPPSILMVMYGIITEQSVGKLLIAGIFPGLLAAFNYMVMIYIRVKRNPELAPLIRENVTWKERIISIKSIWGIAILGFLVMGGIYSGAFTPSEAGAVGAFGAFVMALAVKRLNLTNFKECLIDVARTTGMVFLIIASAFMFGRLLAVSRIPVTMSEVLVGSDVPRFWILMGVMLMYLVMGFFIDMLAAMFITLPVIFPAIVGLGYDPIWFGVLMVHLCEVALITPPFGLNLFILKGTMPGIDLKEVIQGIFPFFIVDLITLALYIAFPQIALYLPSKMMGG